MKVALALALAALLLAGCQSAWTGATATDLAGRLTRVSDSDPAMLRYLDERGIRPGDVFEVVDRQPFGGPSFVRFHGEVHVLGGDLAAAMRVVIR